jgi:hypothetical protein
MEVEMVLVAKQAAAAMAMAARARGAARVVTARVVTLSRCSAQLYVCRKS